MQSEVELHDLFSYSTLYIIVFVILLLLFGAYFLVFKLLKKIKRKPKTEVIVNQPPPLNVNQIKAKYLNALYGLEIKVNNNSITNREAYINTSSLIREFVYEVTNVKVQNFTLSEIQKVNLPWLYELVNEYYGPEFDIDAPGNIKESIIKTREAIEKWS